MSEQEDKFYEIIARMGQRRSKLETIMFDGVWYPATPRVLVDDLTWEALYHEGYREPRYPVPAIPCVAVLPDKGYRYMVYIDDLRFGEDDPQMVRMWDFYPKALPIMVAWHHHHHNDPSITEHIPGHQPVPAHNYAVHFTAISVEMVTGVIIDYSNMVRNVPKKYKELNYDCKCVLYVQNEDILNGWEENWQAGDF